MAPHDWGTDGINSVFVLHQIADGHGVQPPDTHGAACPLENVTTFSTSVEWDYMAAQNMSRILANEMLRLQ